MSDGGLGSGSNSLSGGGISRRTSKSSTSTSNSTGNHHHLYLPTISSPLAPTRRHHHYPSSSSSSSSPPPSNSSQSTIEHEQQRLPLSSPHSELSSFLPLSDLPQSEPDFEEEEEAEERSTMIGIQNDQIMDEDPLVFYSPPPPIGVFRSTASSSPGPMWLPSLQPTNPNTITTATRTTGHGQSRRASGWKQPPIASTSSRHTAISQRSSPSTADSNATPLSSPTPISRAYTTKPSAQRSSLSPSELRQQAANRLRAIDRNQRLSARRPLLDAFILGSQKGKDDEHNEDEKMMIEINGRRESYRIKQQIKRNSSDEIFGTDQLIQFQEEYKLDEELPDAFEIDIDPSKIYEAYEEEGEDTMMDIIPNLNEHQTLKSVLCSSVCPSCSQSKPIECLDLIECNQCNWKIPINVLDSVDQYFLNHGSRSLHVPIICFNSEIGTQFVCSHPDCDEILAV